MSGPITETIDHLLADEEGHEATLHGVAAGLRALRGGELRPHDQELIHSLAANPIEAIKLYQQLKQEGHIDAA